MSEQRTIFWDVDTQDDFLNPGGKLYVPGSEKILGNLARLTRWAADHDVLVVASVCAHQEGDAEFRDWAPHCLVGTEGQRKVPETSLPSQLVIANRKVAIPQDLRPYQQVVVEKQELDVATNPNADDLLTRLGRRDVVLYGVVTELCVALAAQRLLDRGFGVRLVRDAVCALDETKAQQFLEEITRRGGTLVSTEDVIERRAA